MKEWLYELLEKLTGKHYHIFDKPSQIEYLDGTQFFYCRCGAMAKIKKNTSRNNVVSTLSSLDE